MEKYVLNLMHKTIYMHSRGHVMQGIPLNEARGEAFRWEYIPQRWMKYANKKLSVVTVLTFSLEKAHAIVMRYKFLKKIVKQAFEEI